MSERLGEVEYDEGRKIVAVKKWLRQRGGSAEPIGQGTFPRLTITHAGFEVGILEPFGKLVDDDGTVRIEGPPSPPIEPEKETS